MTQPIRLRSLLTHAFVIVIGFCMLYPILWMISSSFKPEVHIFSDPGLWPKEFTLQNYVKGWHVVRDQTFATFFINSFKISLISVVANLLTCSMAAYAFGRMRFPLRSLWFACMLMTIMLPSHVTLIPRYAIFHYLDWINTILPLTVPKFLASEAFFIFLMVQFIRGIPRDLDESATIDGCGPVQIYLRIVLPLMLPALISTAIFSFIWAWDDFFSQMLYLNSVDQFTVSLGLRLFLDSQGASSWGSVFAMSILSMIPVIIVFFVFQKYIVDGIATTGIKG